MDREEEIYKGWRIEVRNQEIGNKRDKNKTQ